MSKKCKVRLVQDRVTKNTVRFAEIENDQDLELVVGTLYVKQVALPKIDGEWPTEVTLEITVEG